MAFSAPQVAGPSAPAQALNSGSESLVRKLLALRNDIDVALAELTSADAAIPVATSQSHLGTDGAVDDLGVIACVLGLRPAARQR